MVHLLVYSRLFGLFITNSAEAIKSKPVGSNIVANILDSVENIYFSPGYFCVVLVYFSWLFLHLELTWYIQLYCPYPRPTLSYSGGWDYIRGCWYCEHLRRKQIGCKPTGITNVTKRPFFRNFLDSEFTRKPVVLSKL